MKTRHPSSARPFRLWDANAKRDLRWRCYKAARSAHLGALVEARWSKVGTSIEVYDCTTGRLHGQYTRTPTSIIFQKG
jgi:hypothetical protein